MPSGTVKENLSLEEPVIAITEKEAQGPVADFYEDIRSTLGVPVVNLIWRLSLIHI